jgi:hypothetical protein
MDSIAFGRSVRSAARSAPDLSEKFLRIASSMVVLIR